jgi:hypothetical protein
MSRQNSTGSWIAAVIVVLGVVAAGVYLARRAMQPDTHPAAAVAPATSGSMPATTAPVIEHPISQASVPAEASTAELPTLDDSDASVAAQLLSLSGGSDLQSLLVSSQIIPHIVATVDSLPRHGLATLMLPLRTPKGSFAVTPGQAGPVMDDRNAGRYQPYMHIVESVDAKTLVAWYVRTYPLFQQAYRQLGYPKGYFNDRLIVAINNLLAAPDLAQPVALVPTRSTYAYADPSLESLSAGQKLMMRVGPANEARLKAKLREIQAWLVGHPSLSRPAHITGG